MTDPAYWALRHLYFILGILLLPMNIQAQIESFWIDTTTHDSHEKAFFFTNRPYIAEEGVVTFRNKSARRGASDFAILQHLLEDFLSDSVFFATQPKDLYFTLTCTSMGNQLMKENLLERGKQGIPLQKVYNDVIWNKKDVPLKLSETMNLRIRPGNNDPRNPEKLPGCIRTFDITYWLREEDRSGLWHNYLLTNNEVQKALLE